MKQEIVDRIFKKIEDSINYPIILKRVSLTPVFEMHIKFICSKNNKEGFLIYALSLNEYIELVEKNNFIFISNSLKSFIAKSNAFIKKVYEE